MGETGYVVGVGAANVDVHGRSRAPIVMRDSNPGALHTSPGGVTRNVLENLARQGADARLVSAVGDDVYGELIVRRSSEAGIDVSSLLRVPGASSSCYIAVLDERGDMLLGMSDMSILKRLTPEYIDSRGALLRGAAAVVCDPCLPPGILERVLDAAGDVRVFLDPVSTAYARVAKPFVGRLFCVKPNRMELAVLSGLPTDTDAELALAAGELLSRGCRRVVVSLGERGAYWADADGTRLRRSLRPLAQMANATGAGDAFMSGLVWGEINRLPPEDTLYRALACGVVAIESEHTISPRMSDSAVREALEKYGK